MDLAKLQNELNSIIEEYGTYPYEFFNILHNSENANLDLQTQNELWSDLKQQEWHDLNLTRYVLWAISDNGDVLWWNGVQTVAINPRAQEFMSLAVSPQQFIKLVKLGKVTGIFPKELWESNTC